MSATETTTDTPAPTETPAVTLTLAEQVRKVLHEAATPLAFKDISNRIAKLYPKGTKKAPKPAPPSAAEIQAELDLPGVSVHPAPKPDGLPKYWHKPPLDEQILKLFEPTDKKKLADVMEALDGTPATKLVVAAIKKLVTDSKLFTHGKGKEVEYATFEQPPPLTATQKMQAMVRAKVAALGDEVVAEAKLGKPPAKQGAEVAEAFEQLLKQLVADKKLFAYAGGKYSRKQAPTVAETMAETLRGKMTSLGDKLDDLVTANQLGKPKPNQGEEAAEAFDQVLKQLVAEKKLFAYAGGKYSRKEPILPEWYETPAHKKSFEALLKATNKVLESDGVTVDQVFAALRVKLAQSPPVAKPVLKIHEPSVVTPPPEVPPHDLRTVLKQAYDHLCQFPEFRDKLVELPSLYHDAVERMPGLTSEKFQHELWQMSTEWVIELHVLNETYLAKEPHLAIHRNDRLYYYARWK